MNSFLIANSKAKGPGFGMFSPTHFAALAVLALISFFIIRYYLKASEKKRNRIRIIVATLIFCLEIGKDTALLLTGQFTYGDWPFQLCGIGIFIVAYDAWRRDKTSRELLYSLTLPGACMALLTPDWVINHIINLFVWQSFTIHMLLVTYVLMQLIAREFRPNWQQLWRVVIFLVFMVPIAAVLNRLWNQNFFYIETPVPGSPLEPVHSIFGPYYLFGMVLLVAVFWLLMYLPWSIFKKKEKN